MSTSGPSPALVGSGRYPPAGGRYPTWSRNGRELFYRTLGISSRLMVVSYQAEENSFHAGKPRLWSEEQFSSRRSSQTFDLHPDGKRFAVLKVTDPQEEAALDKLNLVTNWFDEVRRRVAAAGQN